MWNREVSLLTSPTQLFSFGHNKNSVFLSFRMCYFYRYFFINLPNMIYRYKSFCYFIFHFSTTTSTTIVFDRVHAIHLIHDIIPRGIECSSRPWKLNYSQYDTLHYFFFFFVIIFMILCSYPCTGKVEHRTEHVPM